MPKEVALAETQIIRQWAIDPYTHYDELFADLGWVRPWLNQFHNQYTLVIIPIVVLLCSICVLIIIRVHPNGKPIRIKIMWLYLLTPMASLVFWLYSAPSLRFLGATLWILSISMVVLAFQHWKWHNHKHYLLVVILIMTFIGFLPARRLISNVWTPLDKKFGLYPPYEQPVQLFTTASGLQLWIPLSGDQCWNAPLPCTPYPSPALVQRVENDLGSGFIFHKELGLPFIVLGYSVEIGNNN